MKKPLFVIYMILLCFPVLAQEDWPEVYIPHSIDAILPELEVITPENADRLQFIGYIGRGQADEVLQTSDGEWTIVVDYTRGIWIYSNEQLWAGSESDTLWRDPQRIIVTPMGYASGAVLTPDETKIVLSGGWGAAYGSLLRVWQIDPLQEIFSREIGWLDSSAFLKELPFSISPDSRFLAYGDQDGDTFAARIVDLQTGEEIQHFTQDTDAFIRRVQYSPDGKLLAVSDWNSSVHLYDIKSGSRLFHLYEEGIRNVEIIFSPDNRWMTVAGSEHVYLYNIHAENGTWLIRNGFSVDTYQFSPDSTWLAYSFYRGVRYEDRVFSLYFRNLNTEQSIVFDNLTEIENLIFSDDDARVAWQDCDAFGCLLRLLDLENERIVYSLTGDEPLQITENGLFFALNEWEYYWNPDSGVSPAGEHKTEADLLTESTAFLSQERLWITDLFFSPDGDLILNNPLRFVTWHDGRLNDIAVSEFAHRASANDAVLFSPDGSYFIAARHQPYRGDQEGWQLVRNESPEYPVLAEVNYFLPYHRERPEYIIVTSPLAISPDGKTIASGHASNTIRLWDVDVLRDRVAVYLDTGAETLIWQTSHSPEEEELVTDLAFLPDGRLVSGSSAGIQVWDWQSGEIEEVSAGEIPGQLFDISTDGNTLVTTRGEVWNLATATQITSAVNFNLDSYYYQHVDVKFSPDGRLAMYVSQNFDIYNIETGTWLASSPADRSFIGADGHFDAIFSPDGKMIISGGGDGALRIWGVPAD